jgi:signal transduction histidine kinase
MTDHTTKPNTSEPKYRKRLNKEQLAVLNLLHTFRFASSEQIATYQKKPGSKSIQKRLKILEDQNLIAKRYDKSYKLRGKPAAYYLLPNGARALATLGDRRKSEPITIKRIYKDKDVSEGFIQHCLNLLNIYLALRAFHGDKLRLFTKSYLKREEYDYFPQPLPDTYFYLKIEGRREDYILDIFEDAQPFFVLVRRIKKYMQYAESEEWPGETLPTILIVVESSSVHKRLRKRIAKELQDSYGEEITFATARLDYLLNPENKGEAWFPVDEDRATVNEPRAIMSLIDLKQCLS